MATPFPPVPPPPPAMKKSSPLVPILVVGGLAVIGIAAAITAGLAMLVSRDRDAHQPASELPVVEKPREPEPAPAFVDPDAQKSPAAVERAETPPARERRPAARPAPAPRGVVGNRLGEAPPDAVPFQPRRPIRVGGDIPAPTKVHTVSPVYPQIAISARVQGVVVIEATIGTDGRIQDTKVLRSIPLLDQAALEAVRQWEYTPTRLNGEPVPVIMTVTVNFTLQ